MHFHFPFVRSSEKPVAFRNGIGVNRLSPETVIFEVREIFLEETFARKFALSYSGHDVFADISVIVVYRVQSVVVKRTYVVVVELTRRESIYLFRFFRS